MAANKQHYNAGYSAALRDLMEVIQQGVSVGHLGGESGNEAEGGMTIGRVMDWIDARLDAIKAMGEDEDDDERDKESGTKAKVGGSNRISAADRGDKQRSYPSVRIPSFYSASYDVVTRAKFIEICMFTMVAACRGDA
jgi:hypothetical protein